MAYGNLWLVIPALLKFMAIPTIHQLTTLILQSIRTSECRFTQCTGSIAGPICAPDGGGEDAVVPSSPRALSSAAGPPGQRASPADAAVAVRRPSGPR